MKFVMAMISLVTISATARASEHCSVGGREQTAVVATCEATQTLRDRYGWGFKGATLELVKARFFDCVNGERIPGKEFFATVETDDRMLALDVEGDWDMGKRQKGTWSSEDSGGIYIQQKLKKDKDLFQVNFNKKTNKLRYIMRHRSLLWRKVVSDVVFTCERVN